MNHKKISSLFLSTLLRIYYLLRFFYCYCTSLCIQYLPIPFSSILFVLLVIMVRVLSLKHLNKYSQVIFCNIYNEREERDLIVSCSPLAPYTRSRAQLPDSVIMKSADSTSSFLQRQVL